MKFLKLMFIITFIPTIICLIMNVVVGLATDISLWAELFFWIIYVIFISIVFVIMGLALRIFSGLLFVLLAYMRCFERIFILHDFKFSFLSGLCMGFFYFVYSYGIKKIRKYLVCRKVYKADIDYEGRWKNENK